MRLRIEAALRASEERFAKAFRASLDAIAIVQHPSMRIIEINDRWEMLFGYRRSEAIGSTIDDLRDLRQPRGEQTMSPAHRARRVPCASPSSTAQKIGATLRAALATER